MLLAQGNSANVSVPDGRTLAVFSEGEAHVTMLTGRSGASWLRVVEPDRPFHMDAGGSPFTVEIRALTGTTEYTMLYPVPNNAFPAVPFTGNRTLRTDDNGKLLRCDDNSNVTVTVPAGLPVGFNVAFVMWGAGTVTIAAGSGATNRSNKTSLSTQYQAGSLVVLKAAEFVLWRGLRVANNTTRGNKIFKQWTTE